MKTIKEIDSSPYFALLNKSDEGKQKVELFDQSLVTITRGVLKSLSWINHTRVAVAFDVAKT